MMATIVVQMAMYAASSEAEDIGAGGTIVGVRYSLGRMLVRTQEVVVFEAPFVFCAAG